METKHLSLIINSKEGSLNKVSLFTSSVEDVCFILLATSESCTTVATIYIVPKVGAVPDIRPFILH